MIDLSKDLPNTITVDGKSYLVKTDFRDWLKFSYSLNNKELSLEDIEQMFVNRIPQCNFVDEFVEFYNNPNPIPNYKHRGNERVTDYLVDSEFIYASFLHCYGIDLCDPNLKLHWHQFKALLFGLPDESRYKQILAMRCADLKDSKKKPEDIARENKQAWALPMSTKDKIDEEEIERELQELFYNC